MLQATMARQFICILPLPSPMSEHMPHVDCSDMWRAIHGMMFVSGYMNICGK